MAFKSKIIFFVSEGIFATSRLNSAAVNASILPATKIFNSQLDVVTGGSQTVQIPKATGDKKFSSPAWLDDIKSEMNPAELVPINSGNFLQKFKGIFQRMQLD